MHDEVVILGAGLAGLGCARSLPGARLFEASDHSGGRAYSFPAAGFAFDQGAHICHSKNPEYLELVRAQNRGVHVIDGSTVSNYWKGQWQTYPVQNHLAELPLSERVAALTDLVMAHVEPPSAPENYDQWCRAQYGDFLSENFYRVFTEKYWRVAMKDLGVDWLGGRLLPSVLPRILRGALTSQPEEQAAFTRFHYPVEGGYYSFYRPLFDGLPVRHGERAVEIDLQTKEIRFASGRREHYGALATSIPLPDLVRAIKDAPARAREAAAKLKHTRLLCVNLVVDRPELSKNHWLYIYDHEIQAARVSFPSNLAGRAGEAPSTLQAEVFRRDDEPWNVEALVDKTVREMARLFGFDPRREVLGVHPVEVPMAYVISDLERKPSVDFLLGWLRENDIFSMGLYGRWSYVWSDVAFFSGVDAAAQIKACLCP